MKVKESISKIGSVLGIGLVLFLIIGFVEKGEIGYRVDDIDVEIENAYENFFIDEADVMALIMENEGDSILGDKFGRVSLKDIERRIESHSFVKDAEVFRDLKGHLVVKARQNKPVARLISNSGKHAYIGAEGDLLPVSAKYTARVPVITGAYVSKMLERANVNNDSYDQKIFSLINYINDNEFWTMQIGQVDVDMKGNVVMYPQVGDQRLEFGPAEDIDKKFKRLNIFFKQIMPTKGWNTYDRVNVAYKDQIICE